MMIDTTSFLDTDLSVDDVVDFCISSGKTESTLRMESHSETEFDLYDGEVLRGMSYVDGNTLVADFFDNDGELNDWSGRPARTVRDLATRDVILVEHYKHGSRVEKLMRVPLKSEFVELD